MLKRVTDDGCGIEKDQAETAFLRHATSKIASMQDLNAIGTLGFRGEALASIAAVTRTELITKTRTEKLGTRLLIHGGEVLTKEGTGCPDGTTIIVSDLFYNTPARRKFMKSDSAESARIIDFMSQIALAYPDVRFRFINSGNVVFSTTGKGDVLAAILSVYKLKEYQNLVPVDYSWNGTSVTGYISGPALSRTSRRSQIFFVNGRVVSSRVIEKGVSDGYRERLFEGRYPVAFLFLQTDPSRLDVNIHPNKKEIRFDNEAEIADLVAEAVRQALGTKAAVPEIRDTERIFRREDPVKAETPGVSQKEEQVDIKQILSSTKRDIPQQTSFRGESFSRTGEAELRAEIPQQASMVREKVTEYKGSPEEAGAPVISLESPAAVPFDFEDLTVTGTIFDTYITAVDLAMTVASTPFFLVLAGAALLRSGWPPVSQTAQAAVVAICAGTLATSMFFRATQLVRASASKLAVVESTQCGEVVFSLLGGVLLLHEPPPDAAGYVGLALITGGMVVNSLLSGK